MDEEKKQSPGWDKRPAVENAAGAENEDPDTERAKQRFSRIPAHMITYGIIVGTVLLAGILFILISGHWKYGGYRVVSSRKQEDTMAASYCSVGGSIFRYGTDGASLSDRSGAILWDVNYSMDDPAVVVRDTTVAVYDRSGSTIVVCGRSGQIGKVSTKLPIVRVTVSADGNVAVIGEDSGNAYIEYYKPDGSQIAEIRTSMDNPGYPLDVSVSEDGELLAVSYLSLSGGTEKAIIRIYSFGAAGQNQMDNRIGDFEYNGKLMPDVEYLNGSELAVFSDDGFTLYTGSRTPSEERSVLVSGEIQSVFHDGSHIGLVTQEGSARHLHMYNASGRETLDKEFNFSYTSLDFNGEDVSFYNNSDLCVFSLKGVCKFNGSYNGSARKIVSLGKRRYAVVKENSLDLIQLR